MGFPSGSAVKNLPAMQEMQETGFDPWIGKILWRRKWQPTPAFCQENPMDRGAFGLQLMGSQELGMTG